MTGDIFAYGRKTVRSAYEKATRIKCKVFYCIYVSGISPLFSQQLYRYYAGEKAGFSIWWNDLCDRYGDIRADRSFFFKNQNAGAATGV